MCIYIYIKICLSLSLSLSIYIYICMYIFLNSGIVTLQLKRANRQVGEQGHKQGGDSQRPPRVLERRQLMSLIPTGGFQLSTLCPSTPCGADSQSLNAQDRDPCKCAFVLLAPSSWQVIFDQEIDQKKAMATEDSRVSGSKAEQLTMLATRCLGLALPGQAVRQKRADRRWGCDHCTYLPWAVA